MAYLSLCKTGLNKNEGGGGFVLKTRPCHVLPLEKQEVGTTQKFISRFVYFDIMDNTTE
jgi:hypothetical protein